MSGPLIWGPTGPININAPSAGALQSDSSGNITAGVLPVSSGGTGTGTAFTLGSVVFAGASGVFSQDNTNFFWDNTNKRHGIGTATPATRLHVVQSNDVDAIRIGGFTVPSSYLDIFINNLGNPRVYTPNTFVFQGDSGLVFRSLVGGSISLQDTSAGSVLIANGSGVVGVGTASPQSKLHVNSQVAATPILRLSGAASQSGDYLQILDSAANTLAKFDSTGLLTIGQSADATARLKLVGGTSGGALITLQRPGTTTQFSWSLAGSGLVFNDDVVAAVCANIFADVSINQLYLGQRTKGISDTRTALLSGTTFGSAAGTNVPGQSLTIQPGAGTGNAATPSLLIKTADITTSGTTSQSYTTKLAVTGLGNVSITPSTSVETSGSVQALSVVKTYNQVTSTASNVDLYINRTETSIGSGSQYLIQAQVNSVNTFLVNNKGAIGLGSSFGSAGQYLQSNGSGSLPTWSAVTPNYTYTAQTTTYSASVGDYVNCTSGTFTVTLPTAVGNAAKSIYVLNSGSGVITIATTSAQTVGGLASASAGLKLATTQDVIQVTSDGANWQITNYGIKHRALYHLSANATPSANTKINFDTADYDPAGLVTAGASWAFTAPYPGNYKMTVYMQNLSSTSGGAYGIYKNGSSAIIMHYFNNTATPGTGFTNSSASIQLAVSDTIDLRFFGYSTTIAGGTLTGGGAWINIERVG